MLIDSIPFIHFFIEVKELIQPQDFILLNPYRQIYLKIGNIYIALGIDEKILTVEFAINTGKKNSIDWTQEIYNLAKEKEMEKIVLHTAEDNYIVQNIAKNWKFKQTMITTNYYNNAKNRLTYELNLKEN